MAWRAHLVGYLLVARMQGRTTSEGRPSRRNPQWIRRDMHHLWRDRGEPMKSERRRDPPPDRSNSRGGSDAGLAQYSRRLLTGGQTVGGDGKAHAEGATDAREVSPPDSAGLD